VVPIIQKRKLREGGKTRSDEFEPETAGLLAASQGFSYESNFDPDSETYRGSSIHCKICLALERGSRRPLTIGVGSVGTKGAGSEMDGIRKVL
jgi:hypothetical protein